MSDASGPNPSGCLHCDAPATCVGESDEPGKLTFSCDECCNHDNDDFKCRPIAKQITTLAMADEAGRFDPADFDRLAEACRPKFTAEEKIAARVLCESDRRWPRLTEEQRATWLRNAKGDRERFALVLAAVRAGMAAIAEAVSAPSPSGRARRGAADRHNAQGPAGSERYSRPSVDWQAECARLTAQLAATLEGISDALAGPNAARNCDFRTPTVEEVTETAKRLRERFEQAREAVAAATARAGEAAPEEVVQAARFLSRLASQASPDWKRDGLRVFTRGREVLGIDGRDNPIFASGPDAVFAVEARTLAPFLAEWALRAGGGR